jgi:transcriptional regulator with XRE-family HTH domain
MDLVKNIDENDRDKRVGANIRMRREGLGLTQEALAKETGLTKLTISEIENGKRQARKANLIAIAKSLNCTSLDLEGHPDAAPRRLTKGDLDPAALFRNAELLSRIANLTPDHLQLVLATIYKDPEMIDDPEVQSALSRVLQDV